MNERIKELAQQAGFVDYMVYGRIESKEDVLKKFAELIVRECAQISELKEQGYSEYDPNMSVGWYMRQHFGIQSDAGMYVTEYKELICSDPSGDEMCSTCDCWKNTRAYCS